MANPDRPFGLRPVGTLSDAMKSGKIRVFEADAARNTSNEIGSIFVGDPVMIESDGRVTAITATPTDAAIGVCVGVQPYILGRAGFGSGVGPHTDPNLQRKYLPANVAGFVFVCTDPNQIYIAQEDSDAGALALTHIGNNINIIGPTAHGSVTSGISLFELDSSTAATTNTLQFKIVEFPFAPNNEVGDKANWYVKFNRHHYNVVGMTGV